MNTLLTHEVADMLLHADGKALATYGSKGLNVVPVSSICIEGESIWLINYFMDKTLTNLLENNEVSLACWKGLAGFQIRATAMVETEGEDFVRATEWIKCILPDRVVLGLIKLTPTKLYSVDAKVGEAGKEIV